MNGFPHLDDRIAEAMLLPTPERIEVAQRDRWVGYGRAQEALQALDDLLSHPRTLRMPNMLLVGESGNGKSTVISKFQERHPVLEKPGGDPVAPVIVMDMPSEPSETRFWTSLLLALKIAHRDSDPVQRKENQAVSVLTYVQARMLVIDEVHNVLFGSARQQRHFLAVLKNLSNRLKLPIVAVGTRDAILALHTDTQLSSRFEPLGLPRWKLNQEFLRLLASFERLLPLADPSNLASREIAIKLHGMGGGTIGGVSKVLKKAATSAIRSGRECIDLEVLDGLKWVKLSDYDKLAEEL